jgi:phage shock protein A
MTRGEFIDGVQTAGIFIIAALMIYVVVRLDRTVTAASKRLKTMIVKQQGLEEGIERVWKRVELLESLQSQKTFVPTAESMAMLKEIRRRIDTLEANHEGPPDNHDQPRS